MTMINAWLVQAQTTSEQAVTLVLEPVRRSPGKAGKDNAALAALNQKRNRDPQRNARLAAANCQKIAGRPHL